MKDLYEKYFTVPVHTSNTVYWYAEKLFLVLSSKMENKENYRGGFFSNKVLKV